ncbi:UNVERIFIED_CONTAM: hypothetical protein GTU68_026234 [Idotea baltica]|nr:hypothetical protein [Idotea baltica]
MKVVGITQARSGSTRLPNKVLMNLDGLSLLAVHVKRIQKSSLIDKLIIATTIAEQDEQIAKLADSLGVSSFRGSEGNVLDRFYQSVKGEKPDYVVRLTSDCPLIDAELIDKVINFTIERELDYCSNTLKPSYPDGQDIEVFKFSALERAWKEAKLCSDLEHVTPYIWRNSSFKGGNLFKSDNFQEGYDFENVRITVDEKKDYDLIVKLVEHLGINASWLAYTELIFKVPELRSINSGIERNEGLKKSLENDI